MAQGRLKYWSISDTCEGHLQGLLEYKPDECAVDILYKTMQRCAGATCSVSNRPWALVLERQVLERQRHMRGRTIIITEVLFCENKWMGSVALRAVQARNGPGAHSVQEHQQRLRVASVRLSLRCSLE